MAELEPTKLPCAVKIPAQRSTWRSKRKQGKSQIRSHRGSQLQSSAKMRKSTNKPQRSSQLEPRWRKPTTSSKWEIVNLARESGCHWCIGTWLRILGRFIIMLLSLGRLGTGWGGRKQVCWLLKEIVCYGVGGKESIRNGESVMDNRTWTCEI
jgi:hypothetical protein